jgi:MFS family permease
MQASESVIATPSKDEAAAAAPTYDMKKIGRAGFLGTLIEYYDLHIFTAAAALVFHQLFFPDMNSVMGAMAAFATVGVVFVARPLGSVIFGHFGDRLGRKKTLVVTLLLMGVSTVLVGVLPTAEQVGILAPILLVALRVIQGLAAGGEYAGASLLIAENAPAHSRGRWSCLPNLGGAMSHSLAGVTMLAVTFSMSQESFREWGWRIPFISSALLLAIGLYIRIRMDETPVFKKQVQQHGVLKVPLLEALKTQPRALLMGSAMVLPAFTLLYLSATYVTHYGVNELKLGYTQVLGVTILSGLTFFVTILFASRLSDRIGRRPVIMASNILAAIWVLALFPILYAGSLINFFASVIISQVITGLTFGPIGAFMSELFETRYRYTAVGLCYNLAGIVGGALPPLLAGPIMAKYGTMPFGIALSVVFFACFCCCFLSKETNRNVL